MKGFLSNKRFEKFINLLIPVILLLYPLRHIFVGAEWWDTGYNYGNFVFMDRMDPMWLFSTYLGTAVGHLFTLLPFGNTMVGLNVYTGLFVSALALMGYYFFAKVVGLPKGVTFWGEMLAISFCWCPTALLYNYLTYLLMALGVLFLYLALMAGEEKKQKNLYFVLAGIFLGVNVFTRFPNLAEMGLIVAVWAMAILRKQKISKTVSDTLYCILGYVIGLLAGFVIIAVQYGAAEYVNGIIRLLGMPSEATDYSIRSMVEYQIRNFIQNFLWLRYFVVMVIICVMGYCILSGKLLWCKRLATVGVFLVGLKVLIGQNMFNMKYSTKMSAFQWGVVLLSAALVVLVTVLIRGKRFDDKEKLLAGLSVLIIVITPLGSNNHLYSSINNLFMVAPFTLWMLVRFIQNLPGMIRKVPLEPVKLILAGMLVMITVQGGLFGLFYVFSEGDGGENLHTRVENNAILKGMRTSPERAKLLTEISTYVEEENLAGTEVILYGHIPAMSYYLDMPFAITAWPDLRSYNVSVMEQDIAELYGEVDCKGREIPVILLEKTANDKLAQGTVEERKLQLIAEKIEEYNYEVSFENDKFVLYRAD